VVSTDFHDKLKCVGQEPRPHTKRAPTGVVSAPVVRLTLPIAFSAAP
jgi:hypothetical protein